MTTDQLQIVETHGTALERARQFGEAVRDGLEEYLALTEGSLKLFAGPAGQRLREDLLGEFYRLDPPMELLGAFCEAAATSADIMVERMASFSAGKSRLLGECSGVFLSKAGQVAMAQNLDTGAECAVCNYLEVARGPDTDGYARFCWPDILSYMHGINAHGVCTTGCSGPAGDPMRPGGGPAVLSSRWVYLYECRTVEDVDARVRAVAANGKGVNSIYADASGRALKVEQGGGCYGLHAPEGGWCVATGYRPYISGDDLGQNPPEKAAAEKARWDRLSVLCRDAVGRPGGPVDDLKRTMADHETTGGHPHSAVCRHDETSCSQFSFIYDLTGRVVHYCGQPCCNEWRSIKL